AQYSSVILLITVIMIASHYSIKAEYKYSLLHIAPMSFIILSFAHSGGTLGKALSNKHLVLLGESSFSLYLIHQLVIIYSTAISQKIGAIPEGVLLFSILSISLGLSII